jgi:pimeloyl-ACP methyl ester carboxylesterase
MRKDQEIPMLPSWTRLTAICLTVLACAKLTAQETAEGRRDTLKRIAADFIQLLHQGEFAVATKNFDAAMSKVLPVAELKKTWEKLLADSGAFKKHVTGRLETSGKYEIVYVTCEFAKMKLDARIVFDEENKIAGLFFKKPLPTGVEEIWEGTLKAGVLDLRLVFHLFKQKDGSYTGTMDSPDQGATGLVLDEVTIKDNKTRLELKRLKMVFDGKRSRDGKEMAGDLKQVGQSYPLTLKRVAKAKESRRPQTPRKPYPYREVEVRYENKKDGIKLAGTLTLPQGQGPFPAAILITGSGAQDRDETIFGHKPFLVLADYLTRRGIAVLRADDRGVGGSSGNVQDATSADFADDVRAGIEFLKNHNEINTAQIGLIGHSEGGIIAPLVAGRSRDVAFIVLLAGTGVRGDEILYLQGAAILKVLGADPARLARQKALQERMFAVVRQEKGKAVAEKKLRAAVADFIAKLGKEEKSEWKDQLPALEGQINMLLTPWFRHFLDHDPLPALRRVTCPVLALNGEKDLQVDAKTNLHAIAAALKEAGNPDVTMRAFPNLNHLFQTCKTGAVSEYGVIEETLAPVVLETIAEWITRRTGSQASALRVESDTAAPHCAPGMVHDNGRRRLRFRRGR